MNAEQLIRKHLLERLAADDKEVQIGEITPENVLELYEKYDDEGFLQDYEEEFRGGGEESNVSPDWSRHYESESRATQIDGRWVGWTYWYGGGKHGEPSAIDWMEDAYFLSCKEEEKLVTIRTFEKVKA